MSAKVLHAAPPKGMPAANRTGKVKGEDTIRQEGIGDKLLSPRGLGLWVIAIATFLVLIALDWSGMEQKVSSLAFVGGEWKWKDWGLWKFLYEYGPVPSILVGVGSLLWGIVLLVRKAPRKKWLWALYPFACLAIAPGFLVNALGKDQWGRPRPRDCEVFGGQQHYQHFWSPHFGGEGRSFPSGHASVGFYLCCLSMIPGNRRRWLWLGIGLLMGVLIGMARIAQGGHFITDIVASCGIVLFVSWMLAPSFCWLGQKGGTGHNARPANS
jgi:lipid A 4'-phosphatase